MALVEARHPGVAVAELIRETLDWHAGVRHERRSSVPEIVRGPPVADAGRGDDLFELASRSRRIDGTTDGVGVDEVRRVRPEFASRDAIDVLSAPTATESCVDFLGDVETPHALRCLRLADDERSAGPPLESLVDVDDVAVNVVPRQSCRFSGSEPEQEPEYPHRLPDGALGGDQERLRLIE